jgi:hypothetical protein
VEVWILVRRVRSGNCPFAQQHHWHICDPYCTLDRPHRLAFAAFNYYGSVSAGADVARSREIQIGKFNPTLNVNLNANLNSTIDFVWLQPTYTFATPVLGGQASIALGTFVGRNRTSLNGTLTASCLIGPHLRNDISKQDCRSPYQQEYPSIIAFVAGRPHVIKFILAAKTQA